MKPCYYSNFGYDCPQPAEYETQAPNGEWLPLCDEDLAEWKKWRQEKGKPYKVRPIKKTV